MQTIGDLSPKPNHMTQSSAQMTAGMASPTRLRSPRMSLIA